MAPVAKKRIGILVVAYNAATTLAKVLDRIPDEIRSDIEEVIVSDDHSQDSTYLVGLGYQQVSDLPITLIRQPTNLGYGGNQKAGYDLAIEHGLDIVVMLHGDGQYAPESLPDIVAPLLAGEADAVFGSRIMIKGAARKGGMPLYKYVGNRILSRFENAALGTDLSEFHSGYRAYSVGRPQADPVRAELRRVQLRHPDHHPAPRRRDADRRGAHPHLLRRRDLLRRRLGLCRRRDQGRRRLSAAEGRLRRRQPDRPQRGVPAQAQRGQLARPDLHVAQVAAAEQDPRPRDARAGCWPNASGPWATTSPASISTRSTGWRERTDAFFQADLNDGIPTGGGNRLRHRAAADVLEHLVNPGALMRQVRDVLDPGRHGDLLRAQHRPLVPAVPFDPRDVRLRPARHPRLPPTCGSSPGAASAS